MNVKNDYTKEELFEIARNYTSRKDFRENCPKEYTCADKLDILTFKLFYMYYFIFFINYTDK